MPDVPTRDLDVFDAPGREGPLYAPWSEHRGRIELTDEELHDEGHNNVRGLAAGLGCGYRGATYDRDTDRTLMFVTHPAFPETPEEAVSRRYTLAEARRLLRGRS